jgi:hypothetical protein
MLEFVTSKATELFALILGIVLWSLGLAKE